MYKKDFLFTSRAAIETFKGPTKTLLLLKTQTKWFDGENDDVYDRNFYVVLFIMVYGVVSFSKEVVYVTFSSANMYQTS